MFHVSRNGGKYRRATIGIFIGGPIFGWASELNQLPYIIDLVEVNCPRKSNAFKVGAKAILKTRAGDTLVCVP